MIDRSKEARALFLQGYNCSQAVFGAYAKDLGMDQKTAFRVAASFGGGVGRMREMCGACSGMFLVAGMLTGATEGADQAGKKYNYQVVRELAECFKKRHGSTVCKEMLAAAGIAPESTGTGTQPEKRTDEYYRKRPCPDLIEDAARIVAEYFTRKERGSIVPEQDLS